MMCVNKIQNILSQSFIVVLAFMMITCSKDETSPNGPSDTVPNAATINLGSTQQVIRGFGGTNVPGWRPDMTEEQVNRAFGNAPGQIGMSILRVRIAPSDTEFHMELPTARLAQSLGAIVIASPWTPPAWMKSKNNIVGGTLNDSSYDDYAAHLKSFADYMAGNGVPLYAVSVQNEPDVTVTYESCHWNAAQLLKFVKYNAPAIGTIIIVPEAAQFQHSLSDPILNDLVAAANISIIGGHIYGGGLQSYPLAVSKGKELWMTEHLSLAHDWFGALQTGKEINDCMNAGMQAYIWWYIVRFYGPIAEDGSVSKRGYVMSQYARFVRPGYTRVSATKNPQADVYVTAYKGDSKVVIVVVNYFPPAMEQTFIIQNGTVAAFTPYVTSEDKNMVREADIPVTNGSFRVTLEAESVTTLVSN